VFAGRRRSISAMISTVQRIASAMALTVAGTHLPPSLERRGITSVISVIIFVIRQRYQMRKV
jgi:hypothetical protein